MKRPVVFTPSRAAGDVSLQAQEPRTKVDVSKLGPQACDDKLCYNPVSLPLSWTLTLRSLVFQRPVVAQ